MLVHFVNNRCSVLNKRMFVYFVNNRCSALDKRMFVYFVNSLRCKLYAARSAAYGVKFFTMFV